MDLIFQARLWAKKTLLPLVFTWLCYVGPSGPFVNTGRMSSCKTFSFYPFCEILI
jgi:hypothetical protein